MKILQSFFRTINYACLKPALLNRMFLMLSAIVIGLSSYLLFRYGYQLLAVQNTLLFCSIIIGAFIATWTEDLFSTPAERVMNFISGFGTKGEDAEFDESGVPVVSLRKLGEVHYNPVRIAMAGFEYEKQWRKTGEHAFLEKMLNCADSLLDHLIKRKCKDSEFGVWEHYYPWAGLTPPWVSGLAQGVGVQLLSRSYVCCREDRYLEAARLAFRAFHVEVKDGGVTYKDDSERWWFEEYAAKGCVESRVLNGIVYALVGIDEYRRISFDPEVEAIFNRGVQGLLVSLDKFDAGWWTFYDSLGVVASKSYHRVHIQQMKQMYDLTKVEDFKERWLKWGNYRSPFFVREFIRQRPGWHDLMTLILNVCAVFLFLEFLFFIIKFL